MKNKIDFSKPVNISYTIRNHIGSLLDVRRSDIPLDKENSYVLYDILNNNFNSEIELYDLENGEKIFTFYIHFAKEFLNEYSSCLPFNIALKENETLCEMFIGFYLN